MRLGIVFLLAAPMYAAQPNAIDVHDIIKRSVAATASNWKEAPKYAYVERDVESKKDQQKTVRTYDVLMIEGSPYNKLIAVDDKPLPADRRRIEDEKLQAEIANRRHESKRDRDRRIVKYEKERSQDQAMMREMAVAFDFKLLAETSLNGRDVYRFEATPKRDYVPSSHETKVLTGMKGTLWVDKETCQWVKVEAMVTRPVSFFGFIAKVYPGTRFELEQEPVAGNVWMPKHFSMHVNAWALGFINENSTDDETYRDYRPMSKEMELEAKR